MLYCRLLSFKLSLVAALADKISINTFPDILKQKIKNKNRCTCLLVAIIKQCFKSFVRASPSFKDGQEVLHRRQSALEDGFSTVNNVDFGLNLW